MFTDEQVFEVSEGRHLVVEQVLEEPFIANDTLLNERRRMLLITGPNMGGKSTYMRQNAVIALLAHIGSFVPASAARLAPIDRIFTRIGSSDDLASGRSTFMVEMTETANILHNATPRSLVLMDEVGRGTSTFDGLSLAWAAAVQLARSVRAFTLFATHYFELTTLPEQCPTMANVHLDATEYQDHVVFLHHIQEGPANRSYGLQVAKLAGIPGPVLKAAGQKLRELERGDCATAAPEPAQTDLFASAGPHPAVVPPGGPGRGRSQPAASTGPAVRFEGGVGLTRRGPVQATKAFIYGRRKGKLTRLSFGGRKTQARGINGMTFVVGEDCIKCKHTDCVEVCPVDCFYEGPNFLVIHPDECIDCALCEPECPVDAIFSEDELPEDQQVFLELNAELAEVWPVITEMKESPPDAEEWAGKPNKLALLER